MKTHKQVAVEAIEKITETAGKSADVIDMPRPLPTVIQLVREELLEAENLRLKMALLGRDFEEGKRQLRDQDKGWRARVEGRLGVDLPSYDLDLNSGTGRLKGESDGSDQSRN
jgi:hypothetical protein